MMLFDVPVEVLCEEVFSYLSLSDLHSLNIACTNRPHLNRLWSIYKKPRYISNYKNVLLLRCIGIDVVKVDFENFNEVYIAESTLWSCVHKISTGCPKLRVLVVSYNIPLTNEMVMQLFRGCPQLEDVRLSGERFSDAVITELAQHCHRLHTLSLSSKLITDASIQSICDNCPDLQSIDIYYCNLTDASLIAIANTYPHLQVINISGSKCTDDGLIFFADKCRELHSVFVSGDKITIRGLTALWAANPNITQVSMPENVSDDDIVLLMKSCAQLKCLGMRRCNRVSDAAVIAVAEHCTQLTSIEMANSDHISDASLIALGQHCHELTSIDVSRIPNITDVGVAALAAGCPLLEKFKASYACISDSALTALSSCKELQFLYIHNTGVTADGISMFKKHHPDCFVYPENSH